MARPPNPRPRPTPPPTDRRDAAPRIRVFLADEYPVVRLGLRALIDSQPDMAVVGETGDGAKVVTAATGLRPHVVVVDVSVPGIGGAAAAERILAECPGVKLLALAAGDGRVDLPRPLPAGVGGYALKRSAAADLLRAIRAVAAGETYIDPAVAGRLAPATPRPPDASTPDAGAALSGQEEEVLRLVAQGHPVKQIAASLDISKRTVETYRTRAVEKLGLKNRSDIIRYAAGRGWLTTSDLTDSSR